MKHAIGWLGYESRDFAQQGLCETYFRHDGTLGPIDPRPKGVNGVFFGYMHRDESDTTYVATRARYMDIDGLLPTPVVLVPTRHTDGKGFGPHPSQFGDESAARLLSDMIFTNPDLEKSLRNLATKAGLTFGA